MGTTSKKPVKSRVFGDRSPSTVSRPPVVLLSSASADSCLYLTRFERSGCFICRQSTRAAFCHPRAVPPLCGGSEWGHTVHEVTQVTSPVVLLSSASADLRLSAIQTPSGHRGRFSVRSHKFRQPIAHRLRSRSWGVT